MPTLSDRTALHVAATVGADLAASRALDAEQTRATLLRAAGEALAACGLLAYVEPLHAPSGSTLAGLMAARYAAQDLRARLSDGSDERRYAAAGDALTVLGALWAAS